MNDIVERLRSSTGFQTFRAADGALSAAVDTPLLRQAADEIEQLRAWVDYASAALASNHGFCTPPPDQSLEDWCTTCFLLATAPNGGNR